MEYPSVGFPLAFRGTSFSQHGLSLHELLTSVSIVGVLSTGAVASMQPLLERERLSSDINRLITHLQFTRSEAIRRSAPVTLCKSSDGETCTRASRWEQGWIVFVDFDDDQQVSEGEPVLRVQQPLSPGHGLTWSAALRRNDAISYQPTGQPQKNGTFVFCGRNGTAKTVIVNFVGRPYVSNRTGSGEKPRCPPPGAA